MSIETTLAERDRRKALSDRLIRHKNWRWEYGCMVDGWLMYPGQMGPSPREAWRTYIVNHTIDGRPATVFKRGRTVKHAVDFMRIFDPTVLLDAPGTVGVLLLLLMRADKRFVISQKEESFIVHSDAGGFDDPCLGVALAEVLLFAWEAEAAHAA